MVLLKEFTLPFFIMLLLIAFLAGMLTILTPCVLPVLPVILGGSLSGVDRLRPLIITGTLAISVFLFSLLLKTSTLLIDVPPEFWKGISGGIVGLFGLAILFPYQWSLVAQKLGLVKSEQLLQSAATVQGHTGEVLLGLSLGPVFASCSPTYALILAVVLPQNLSTGVLALAIYSFGLFVPMLAIGYGGRKMLSGFSFFVNPESGFRRGLGALLIVVGLLIVTGYEKKLEIALLNNGLYDFTKLDQKLVESLSDREENPDDPFAIAMVKKKRKAPTKNSADLEKVKALLRYNIPAPELVEPKNWINSEPLTLQKLRGKVVVIDFWTYSCINCIRTLPALKALHEKYAPQGLVILGAHTPEFAFEHKLENVKKAVLEHGLKYAIFQDNDYKTWNAYRNRYWPAKYVIDKQGNLRYTHFGEGAYEQTESVIKYLLTEGKSAEGEIDFSIVEEALEGIRTPETYLGTARRENYVVSQKPAELGKNEWTLSGLWSADEEKVVSQSEQASIALRYTAGSANLVMGFQKNLVSVEIWLDGKKTDQVLIVDEYKLYRLTKHPEASDHVVELRFKGKGVELYAWTFG